MVNQKNPFVKVASLKEYGWCADIPVAIDTQSNLWIATPKLEEMLGWRTDSGREKLASKSFKTFAGKDYKVGKKSAIVSGQGQGKTNFYNYATCLMLVKWQLTQGNQKAINLVVAGFADSFERAAYKALEQTIDDEVQQIKLKLRDKSELPTPNQRLWRKLPIQPTAR
jgi:hypothetical protein